MYDDNFNKLMKFIFKSEGGYNNDPDDEGGETNYGITHEIYDEWNKRHNLPKKNIKNITKKEVMDIYYEWFWKDSGANKLTDLREAYFLFDMAINSGPYNAKQVFKQSNGNIYEYLKNRKKYYEKLIREKPVLEKFRQGWMNRLKDLENNASAIVNSGLYTPPYQNEVTIYDKEYEYSNVLNPYKINKKADEEIKKEDIEQQKQKVQNARNKYLYLKHKEELKTGVPTSFATPVNNSADPFIQGFDGEPKDIRTPSQKVADEIDNDEWDCNEIAFLEGFNNDQPDKHLITEAKERRKNRAKTNGNKGKGPNGEDGYWYTTKKGKHVFVAEDKIA